MSRIELGVELVPRLPLSQSLRGLASPGDALSMRAQLLAMEGARRFLGVAVVIQAAEVLGDRDLRRPDL